MEIRVRIKFTFHTCSCGKVQPNLAENLNIIFDTYFEEKHRHKISPLNTNLSILDLSFMD